MKRILKFRAWDQTQKQMYFVNRLDWKQDGVWAHCNNQHPRLKQIMLNTEVKPLMQFTGLHDKNGREIWEGDILQDEWNEKYQVAFIESQAAFLKWRQTKDRPHKITRRIVVEYEEVIGNIYENNDLID